ncbi:Gfo/Idh/MocA family oxidoreductase [Nonomuraea sp. NPDC046802]|uniref:Gfo/Idh/MocA family protein n=1 Tax=Nonomuraea sp. NPDC046802 TaxID=3154919 RepID=UPI0033EFFC07
MLRIGLLGAAAIAPAALVRPARQVPGVLVAAVAARERARAEQFAARHGIGVVHDSYADLLADPGIDAVYIPLPGGLHAEWTLRALNHGKHVLCEKPMAANQAQARQIAEAAGDLVVMEAFHYRHHPLAERMRAVVGDELGTVRRVRVSLCVPLPRFSDIRYAYELAGGATMDVGCYAVHVARLLGGGESKVVSARARTLRSRPLVDRSMRAELAFPGGASGEVRMSLWGWPPLSIAARVSGERGELSVVNFLAPHVYHRLKVGGPDGTRVERVAGEPTYTSQLRAFHAAVTTGAQVLTDAGDAVVTMGLLDDIYRAAGLPPRGMNQGD